MTTTTSLLVTYEESLLREESSLEEVVNGELHTMPPATFPHSDLTEFLHDLLRDRLDRNRFRLRRDVGYLIADRPLLRYRIPDLAVVEVEVAREFRRGRKPGDPYARFAPAAVVEVLSPSNRKGSTDQLLRDYRDLGVAESLFLDPRKRTAIFNGELVKGTTVQLLDVTIDLNEAWRVFEQGE